MPTLQKITPCLWFDHQGEEAANFYCAIFRDSKINAITHYTEAGHEIHGGKAGSVLTVAFELDGHSFMALNGGPHFKFSEAISMVVHCDSQEEIDMLWGKLSAGGDPAAHQCGWLKDKFGLSWQIVPRQMETWMSSGGAAASSRVMEALLAMKKLDVDALQRAFDGR
jgi:predicted 3-demethylubiquinone-9 3-methyltransferase (glyoxalase superfamily)